jgi:hypothetical protein
MLSFIEVRRQLETAAPILSKFKSEGEFSITAGEFASKIAKALEVEKEAAALAAAIGSDAVLLRVRPRSSGSTVPSLVTPSVFANGKGPVVLGADLAPIPVEIKKYRIGPGGYAVVAAGKVEAIIPIAISDELRNDLIVARDDGQEPVMFEEASGLPPLEVPSSLDNQLIPAIRSVPQRDIPPHSDDVPRLVDLEVLEVLEPSRQYKSPRLSVKNHEDGSVIVGLIATQPIVRCITGQYEGDVELTDAVIGQRFQIVEVEERTRRDGEKVKNEDGTVQKTVIVRNTTKSIEFSF